MSTQHTPPQCEEILNSGHRGRWIKFPAPLKPSLHFGIIYENLKYIYPLTTITCLGIYLMGNLPLNVQRNICKEAHCCGHSVDLINKRWCIHTMESHVVIRKNEKNPYVLTLNNAQDVNKERKTIPQYVLYINSPMCVIYTSLFCICRKNIWKIIYKNLFKCLASSEFQITGFSIF